MKITRFLIVLYCAAVVGIFSATAARAAINSIPDSNVDAYFGSQSDGFQDRFPLSLPSSWATVGPGPYPVAATYLIASAPPPPATLTPSNVTPFGGAGVINNFS